MKVLIAFALIGLASAFQYSDEWEAWKEQYNREYETKMEELERQAIWTTHRNYVEMHNKNADFYGFTTGMNEYADLDAAEFSARFNGYSNAEKKPSKNLFSSSKTVADLADTVDWRPKGYVTAVKNQGQCGSCWAFSTTGSLEGQHFNATGNLVSLSEQNLMDCSRPEGDNSCEGGLMDDAFEYIIKNGGIDTEESYPYLAHDEKKCRYNPANRGATMSSYVDIPTRNEAALQVAVATVGPVSVAIDASRMSFQLYESGVYYSIMCSQTNLDHGVLVVGYGTEGSKDYWLVKNSWGESYGLSGYIKMSRNRNNNCGIATSASYPVV